MGLHHTLRKIHHCHSHHSASSVCFDTIDTRTGTHKTLKNKNYFRHNEKYVRNARDGMDVGETRSAENEKPGLLD